MARFGKNFFKSYLLKQYGDSPSTRKVMMVVDLSMKEDERKTWKEFVEIFDFVLK